MAWSLLLMVQTATLLLLAVQDWKYRSVKLYLLALLFLVHAAMGIRSEQIDMLLFNSLISFIFLSLQLLLVAGYFSLKTGKLVNLTENFLGLGDILFLLALIPLMPPIRLFFYYITGLVFSLAVFFILRSKRPSFGPQLPLITSLAIWLLIWQTGYLLLVSQG